MSPGGLDSVTAAPDGDGLPDAPGVDAPVSGFALLGLAVPVSVAVSPGDDAVPGGMVVDEDLVASPALVVPVGAGAELQAETASMMAAAVVPAARETGE